MIYNIYIILNKQNGHKYLSYSHLPLNKVWQNTLQKYTTENSSLYNTMKQWGADRFTIRIVEEVPENRLEERLSFWTSKYQPEYNKDVMEYNTPKVDNKASYRNGKRKWGYQRTKKPKGSPRHNVIKCRSVETGKLKTLHGWAACLEYCNGKDIKNIKRAVASGGTAYGYKWWIHKNNSDIRRQVYGVNKDGDVTKVFTSISDAMRAFGEEDRGKGICTSIKWKQRWKGYMWFYADVD